MWYCRLLSRVPPATGECFLPDLNLTAVPRLVEAALAQEEAIAELAPHLFQRRDFLYLGRGAALPGRAIGPCFISPHG